MHEEWKTVIGFSGSYEISNFGRVKSLDRLIQGRWGKQFKNGIIMSHGCDSSGYDFAHFSVDGKSKTISIHKLVSAAFMGEKKKGCVVDHIDGNKKNNRLDNLQFITQRENCIKGNMGLLRENRSSKFVGVTFDKNRSKWKSQIRIGDKNIFIGRFSTQEQASASYIAYFKNKA